MMTKEEEQELFKQYAETNDIKIRDRIIDSQMGGIHTMANKLCHDKSKVDDAIQTACTALLTAFHKYDYTRGVRFYTWAYYVIRGAILDSFRLGEDLLKRGTHDDNHDFTLASTDFNYEDIEIAERLVSILKSLNKGEREVLNMYLNKGLRSLKRIDTCKEVLKKLAKGVGMNTNIELLFKQKRVKRPKGEDWRSKLTTAQATTIKYSNGFIPSHVLAKQYCVSVATVNRIRANTKWKHI